jgi:hypothetical protein
LSDTTKGSLRTHKGALGSGKNGNRCRYRVCLAGVQSWPGSTSQLSHIDPTNAPTPNGFSMFGILTVNASGVSLPPKTKH